MSNKVGILTIHSVYNYGAMLQAHALCTYLKSIGHDTEIINYQPYHLNKAYKFYFRDLIYRPRKAISMLNQTFFSKGKFDNFIDFYRKFIDKSEITYVDNKDLERANYDVLLTGSDQIWNPYITNYDKSFLLNFASSSCRKFAYSSSFGVSDIDSNWQESISYWLSKFEKIGVREQSGVNLVKEAITDCSAVRVLDPVFLLEASYWEDLGNEKLCPADEYLLVYSLEVSDDLIEKARMLAKAYGLKIVTIHPFKDNYDFADLCINNAGPSEFISLIRNANFVVTNSFHGTAFSIIFNKKLVCINHSKTGDRMKNIIQIFKLKFDSDVKTGIDFYMLDDISVCEKEKLINESKGFLLSLDI